MRLRAPHSRATRGAAAVEFALVFPLVIALVFGVIEAGWALEQRHDVREDAQNLAREAAINFALSDIDDMNFLLDNLFEHGKILANAVEMAHEEEAWT